MIFFQYRHKNSPYIATTVLLKSDFWRAEKNIVCKVFVKLKNHKAESLVAKLKNRFIVQEVCSNFQKT